MEYLPLQDSTTGPSTLASGATVRCIKQDELTIDILAYLGLCAIIVEVDTGLVLLSTIMLLQVAFSRRMTASLPRGMTIWTW